MVEQRRGVNPPVISKALGKELEHYAGQWVAIEDQRVVASADSLMEVLRLAHEQGLPDPLPYHVAANPGRPTVHFH